MRNGGRGCLYTAEPTDGRSTDLRPSVMFTFNAIARQSINVHCPNWNLDGNSSFPTGYQSENYCSLITEKSAQTQLGLRLTSQSHNRWRDDPNGFTSQSHSRWRDDPMGLRLSRTTDGAMTRLGLRLSRIDDRRTSSPPYFCRVGGRAKV